MIGGNFIWIKVFLFVFFLISLSLWIFLVWIDRYLNIFLVFFKVKDLEKYVMLEVIGVFFWIGWFLGKE